MSDSIARLAVKDLASCKSAAGDHGGEVQGSDHPAGPWWHLFFAITDKKVLVQDVPVNRRNCRVLTRSSAERGDHMMFRTRR